jgi:uncharacterized protein YcbK (DUF882 family)
MLRDINPSRVKSFFVTNAAFAVNGFAAVAARTRTASFNLRHLRLRTAQQKAPRLVAATYVGAFLCSLFAPSSTETAIANGDTRTLYLHHSHTGESIAATFRVNGTYDYAALEKLNYFLRDWRNNDATKMDPRLFDVVWEVYRTAGASQPIVIVSAYRSPATNAMLRRRSKGVAEHSQHILGKAMDTTMPGMSMEKVREVGLRLQRGGVGYYGRSNFVHLDVGNVRHWPRMSYAQLSRLFPDGKTVHLASNGRTLPRYEEARAEIASRGGVMTDAPARGGGNLFAWLFGNREEGEEAEAVSAPAPRRGRAQLASLDSGAGRPSAEAQISEDGGRRTGTKTSAADRRDGRRAPAADPAPASPPEANSDKTVVANLSAAPNPPARPASGEDLDAPTGALPKERAEKGAAFGAPPPPPARPQELLAYSDAPTPPARPAELIKVAAYVPRESGKPASKSDVIGALNAGVGASPPPALARAASLPVVITQGPRDRRSKGAAAPAAALAYAPSLEPEDLQSGGDLVVSARVERSNFRGPALGSAESLPAPSILGQAVMGLRQAARIIPDALSGLPSAGFATAFKSVASTLDCSRFTLFGAAKPSEPPAGSVSIAEGADRSSPPGN